MNFIHQTPEQKMAATTHAAIKGISAQVEEAVTAIKSLQAPLSDKHVETIGFTGLIKSALKTHILLTSIHESTPKMERKLDEIKSAALITNKFLKEIRDKEEPEQIPFPEIPEADFSETNRLLKLLIEEQKKPVTVTLTII